MAPPPMKKRKVEDDDNNKASASSTPASTTAMETKLDELITNFISNLEDTREASNNLLDIKNLQRQVLQTLDDKEQELEKQQVQIVEKYRIKLANLQYEQDHWESKIQYIQNSCATPQLETLCREELDDNLSSPREVTRKFFRGRDVYDPTVDNFNTIQNNLHFQINQRGLLERDVQQTQKQYTNLLGLVKKRTQFLNQLPDKLRDIEKASLPLQRFFAATSAANSASSAGTSTSKYNTSERDTRVQLACELPGPLYTLFVQIQSYIDDYSYKNMSLDIGTSTNLTTSGTTSTAATAGIAGGGTGTAVIDPRIKQKLNPHEKTVLWNIPIPNVTTTTTTTTSTTSSSSPSSSLKQSHNVKMMTITFLYYEQLQLVTAKITSTDDNRIDITTVLQLNPYDTGIDIDNAITIAKHIHINVTGNTTNNINNTIIGTSYIWCNYLAGLQWFNGSHPKEQNYTTGSTRSNVGSSRIIITTLLQHLRSNATLQYILYRILPSNPRVAALLPPSTSNKRNKNNSNTAASSCLAKVTSIQLVDKNSDGTKNNNDAKKTYKIQCKRGNNTLQAICDIDIALYPVLSPPQCSLTGNTLEWGQHYGSQDALMSDAATATTSSGGTTGAPPLHHARLAEIEGRVNDIDGLIQSLREEEQRRQEESKESTSNKQGKKDDDNDDDDGDDADKNTDDDEKEESYYYDWILTHQLRTILIEWDDWVMTSDNTNSSISNDNASNKNAALIASAARSVRGRDRAKVE